MLLQLIRLVSLFLMVALVSQTLVAEETAEQVDSEQAETDTDAALIEQAQKQALERKKMQISGYQPFTVAGQEIDGTYLEEITGDKHGVIVFFHDNNPQLETPSVVTPLRQVLPNYGWSTISFELDYPVTDSILLSPSLEPDASQAESNLSLSEELAEAESATETKPVVMADETDANQEQIKTEVEPLPPVSNEERIQTVISFIEAKDYPRIIFVGHGDGAEIAANIMAPLDKSIDALILIDADDFQSYEAFEKIFKPIVDIYPEQTSSSVMMGVQKRKKITKLESKMSYFSRVVVGANKVFYGFEPRLAKMIRSILNKQFLAEND